jgi:hypothetical protein
LLDHGFVRFEPVTLSHNIAGEFDADSPQVGQLRGLIGHAAVGAIEILDPDHEVACSRSGAKPRHEGGSQISHVERSGGRRSEAAAMHTDILSSGRPKCDGTTNLI